MSDRALADAIAELCANYSSLLMDTGFRADIEDAARVQTTNIHNLSDKWKNDLPCQFDHAIALLAEAGVNGQAAAEAVRSLQDALGPTPLVHWIKSAPVPANAPPDGIDVTEFFRRLRTAQGEVCRLRTVLAEAAVHEDKAIKTKRMMFAGIGLALVGLSAGGLALIAPPAAAAVAGALGSEIYKAVVSTIGNTMFQHYTTPRANP